jgi:tRNA (cmo5U34)-methyltransferase
MTDTKRFDEVAGTWDEDPGRVALARAVADAISRQVGLSPSMDVLDFGCGTGLLTFTLQPRVGTIVGADTSAGMLDVFDRKVQAAGSSSVRSHRLVEGRPLEAAGTFDLIVSSMTLHHVRDLAPLLVTFRSMLRAGGHVALADLDREDGTFHTPDVKDVHHLGFDRREVGRALDAAGFDSVRDTTAFVHRRHGREYPVFLISARAGGAQRRA